jgi:hypothetical protein
MLVVLLVKHFKVKLNKKYNKAGKVTVRKQK